MPYFSRPYRYSPPTAALRRRTSTDNKITKMQPSRQPARAALNTNPSPPFRRASDTYRPNYEPGTYRFNHGPSPYPPNYDRSLYLHQYAAYDSHGEPADQGCYGEAGHYGGQRDRESWSTQFGPGRCGGLDYNKYGGYDGYDRRNTAFEVQSQVPQQTGYYRDVQPYAARRQQYWDQAGYPREVPPTAPAWQGYQGEYQQGYDRYYNTNIYHGQQRFDAPTPSPAYQRQDQTYVPDTGYSQQPYGYQQQPYLTEAWGTANDLNANASTFQPQLPLRPAQNDVSLSAATLIKKDARLASKQHLHVLKRPTPSQDYFQNARQVLQTLDAPRQLLIVLDLNGTLLYRKPRGGSTFVARPKVNEFIQYLLGSHKVMVWSSAKPENVNPMCKKLFDEEDFQQLVAVWARDTLRIPAHAYSSKVQVYKQLSWIWNDEGIAATTPEPAGVWDQSNTVLIDDSMEKAASEPHNLICLEEFQDRKDQKESDVLGQVVKYLEMLKSEKDVSAFMQRSPFMYDPSETFDWDA